MTTSAKLGMKVIGYVIKSSQKTIEEKFYKFPYKSEQEILHVLRRLLSWPKPESDYAELEHVINYEARDYILG